MPKFGVSGWRVVHQAAYDVIEAATEEEAIEAFKSDPYCLDWTDEDEGEIDDISVEEFGVDEEDE